MLTDVQLRALFKAVDSDGSGTIEVGELVKFVGQPAGPAADKYKPVKQAAPVEVPYPSHHATSP